MDSIKKRRVIRENVATRAQPVWRHRVATPLTPRVVRERAFAEEPGLSEERAALRRRDRIRHTLRQLTELDRLVDADEADVLERWVVAEGYLAGRVSGVAYVEERVGGGSVGGASLLPDRVMGLVGRHRVYKAGLGERERIAMGVFVEQMSGSVEALTEAQAGLRFCAGAARDKRRAWCLFLAGIAKRLVAAGY
jgi:hypothetical protein